MVPYLWKHCHSLHHRISTPTPASTVFIDSTDATLQGGLPLIDAAAVVRPHWLTFCAYVAVRIAENVCNHSGLDGAVVDVVTPALPPGGRARIKHHDHHHQYSNPRRGRSVRCSALGLGARHAGGQPQRGVPGGARLP